jgi:hypothetical protein
VLLYRARPSDTLSLQALMLFNRRHEHSAHWQETCETLALHACAQRLDVHFVSPTPVERHACASRHPVPMPHVSWIPAFAGMTHDHKDWQCIYETDI